MEPYPGCMGISEEVKLQSISLELIGMTYNGVGVGREGEKKPYFLINLSVSQIQRIYCKYNFFFILYYLSLVRIDHTEFRIQALSSVRSCCNKFRSTS